MKSNFSFINVYKKTSAKSKVVTQLLYGDIFKKIQKKGKWIKIKNKSDNYEGFVKNENFSKVTKNTHKILSLSANLYSYPSLKKKIKKKLSFGSKIEVMERKNNFYRFNNLWVSGDDIKLIKYKKKDVFKNVYMFVDTKYKWGGKHYKGVDCSGLVQLFLNFNNLYCPRDTKDQIKYFKNKVKLKNIKKNDLIFWKGHVGIALSKKNLIHAYGPFKKTIVMPIKKTIDRIYKTANLKVIGVRRIL